jgi:phage terminase large subunit-like protein
MKFYPWARAFFESTNRKNFLCAANQISKSSTQIRKCIHWATETNLWPKLWRKRPLQFWYLYPAKNVSTTEVLKKWIPEWLPRGSMKDNEKYGWHLEIKNKEVNAIHFKSGVSVYFKTYEQDVSNLQSGSVDAIFFDEELPSELWGELVMRLFATQGYMHGVFTATKGQEFWREVIEERGKLERFPDAFKLQVSVYDCLKYEDGTPSHWTDEIITQAKNSCSTEAEVLRRIYGRFVVSQGLKYPSFSRIKNVKPAHPLPKSWQIFAGIDIGSGGESSHPAAIVFVGVSPDFRQGRVFKGWRGDGVVTTAADVLLKYLELKGDMHVTAAFYDWAAKDFFTIASRMGVPVVPAEKSHERGEQVVNVLFKNDILAIYDLDELSPLVQELCSVQKDTPKQKAADDFVDALRYCVTPLGWDWSVIQGHVDLAPTIPPALSELQARKTRGHEQKPLFADIEDEFNFWNELHDYD